MAARCKRWYQHFRDAQVVHICGRPVRHFFWISLQYYSSHSPCRVTSSILRRVLLHVRLIRKLYSKRVWNFLNCGLSLTCPTLLIFFLVCIFPKWFKMIACQWPPSFNMFGRSDPMFDQASIMLTTTPRSFGYGKLFSRGSYRRKALPLLCFMAAATWKKCLIPRFSLTAAVCQRLVHELVSSMRSQHESYE